VLIFSMHDLSLAWENQASPDNAWLDASSCNAQVNCHAARMPCMIYGTSM
jgi:hypothetical protein